MSTKPANDDSGWARIFMAAEQGARAARVGCERVRLSSSVDAWAVEPVERQRRVAGGPDRDAAEAVR